MNIKRKRKKQNGFTLIEIVAAFVVFALLFATILKIISGSLRSTIRSSGYTQAALWAQSRLDAVGVESKLEEGHEAGNFNEAYRWELEISPYEFEWTDESDTTIDPVAETGTVVDIPVELLRVELKVFWDNDQRQASFTTLRSRRKEI